ncbi:MAG: carbohydrate kinase family protein [Lachnospiraceae bacterium]|nr:carbohydrate kinase family protein [Lachnospiraceae bacterium]
MKNGIAVAGSLILDQHYMVETYPEQGKLTNIRGTDRSVGGTGNLIMDLAKIDETLPVKVSAILGTGGNGRFVKNTLSQYPNIDLCNIVERGDTSMTMVMNAMDNNQRTFFYLPAGSDEYDMECIDWERIQADIFQLEYLLLMKKIDEPDPEYGTHAARILHDARAHGMKTSIDMVTTSDGKGGEIVKASLKYTDYCTINELEAEMITGIRILENGVLDDGKAYAALKAIKACGVSSWVVIHSPSCGYGLDCVTGETVKVKSLALPKGYIKGTTGAGDAYCAGILYGAYREMSIESAMKLGTASAACSLSDTSGTEGMRSYEEVRKVYETYRVE